MKFGNVDVDWLGHSSFRLRGSKVIYIDPFKLRTNEPADFILITHSHFDHFSIDDIKKIRKEKTLMIIPHDLSDKVSGNKKLIKPGDSLEFGNIKIEAVPAYNINKEFHKKSQNWVGYVIDMDGLKVYHAGDTDLIPEMENINVDLALLPIGGHYTMDYNEAAEAINKLNPEFVIPMHYGGIVGKKEDAEKLKKICTCNIIVPEISE